MRHRRRFARFALLFALLTAGCAADTSDRLRFASGLPGITTPAEVVSVQRRGPYLQAKLVLTGRDAQAWSLPSEACQTVFTPGETIRYVENGPDGQWVRGDATCQSSGFGPLTLRRDRGQRATPQGVPRSQASYRTLYMDDDLALLRGQFTEAVHLGFIGVDDLVAVVPRGGQCEKPIAEGVASLEYRGKGPDVMSLVGPGGLCPIQAFLIPPGHDDEWSASAEMAD